MGLFTLIIVLACIVIAANHVATAYRFKSQLRIAHPDVWQRLGKPDVISLWLPRDLALFRERNQGLVDSNPELWRALTRYEASWKYGVPAVIFLVVFHGVVHAF